jgi:aldehyde dehydrogenase
MAARSTPTATRTPYAAGESYGFVIGGDQVAAAEHFDAIDPSTGEPWTQVGEATTADVEAAVEAARTAFRTWRRTSLAQRQEVLWRLSELVASGEDWAPLLATENGRPIREATISDIPTAIDVFRFYAGVVRDLSGESLSTGDVETRAFTVREPLGPIAALIPWNSPLITTALKLAPALAAGNTVVLKPSELAAPSVVEFVRRASGIIPPGVVNVVTGLGAGAGSALVSHPEIAKISFTGGVQTARSILRAAAENITPTLMELGGKSALVVCDDADIESAVDDALTGVFFQNGEICLAASRVLVHRDVYDAFVELLVARTGRIAVGDALDPATQVGPLISRQHREQVAARVGAAELEGARVLSGGRRIELTGELAGGYYFAPTVIEDRSGATSISTDEVFGPVQVVSPWDHEGEVIARANSTQYALAAGVWTADLGRAYRIADALEAGTVWVNTWFSVPAGQPLGGFKRSGFGREMCTETLLEYSAPKAINVRLDNRRTSLWR